jgi:hypothetical protein
LTFLKVWRTPDTKAMGRNSSSYPAAFDNVQPYCLPCRICAGLRYLDRIPAAYFGWSPLVVCHAQCGEMTRFCSCS